MTPLSPDDRRFLSLPPVEPERYLRVGRAVRRFGARETAKDGVGRWALVGLVAFLLVAYFGAVFGPPPPSIVAVTVSALVATIVLAAWTAWIERHRTNR